MKNSKKILSVVLILMLTITSIPAAFAYNYNKITDRDPRANEVYEYAANGTEVGITAVFNNSNGMNFRLSSDYNGAFQINSSTGVVTVKDNTALLNPNTPKKRIWKYYSNIENAYYNQNSKKLRVTKDKTNQRGASFSQSTLNLDSPFEYTFDLSIESSKDHEADGIVFFLNAEKPQIGSNGGSLGYSAGVSSNSGANPGMRYSFGVEFDTWRNSGVNDPNEDHIAFVNGGKSKHNGDIYKFDTPIGDGGYRNVLIKWEPSTKKFTVTVDGTQVLEKNEDIVNNYLNGKSNVYLGITGATGSVSSTQILYNPILSTVELPSITVYKGNTSKTFDINIKHGGPTINVVDDSVDVYEDESGSIIINDLNGSFIEYNPADGSSSKLFDRDDILYDIADVDGVMYGITYSNRHGSKLVKYENGQLKLVTRLTENMVNSLEYIGGKFYYMMGTSLYMYNEKTDKVSYVTHINHNSVGDLAYLDGNLYLSGKNDQNQPKMIEIDMGDFDVTELDIDMPSNWVYGLATHDGKLFATYKNIIAQVSFDQKKLIKPVNLSSSGLNDAYGATVNAGALAKGNIFDNDGNTTEVRVKQVNQSVLEVTLPMEREVVVNGNYGILYIMPNGNYRYEVDNESEAVHNLNDGDMVTDNFNIKVGYANTTVQDKNTILEFIIKGKTDGNSIDLDKGLHIDARDIDGNGSTDEVYIKTTVQTWNDSAGVNNKAISTTPYPLYNKYAFGELAGVDFKDTTRTMHIATHAEINDDVFDAKSFAFVIKTGEDISGSQYIYEQGGPVRGYNLSIVEDTENSDKPTLWAMIYNNNSNEWEEENFYKSINLGEVEANTVYYVYLTHDAESGQFKAYVNGDFASVNNAGAVDGVIQQYKHPNPVGVGGINSKSINPVSNQVEIEGAVTAYKGIVGEIITWNSLLTFDDIDEVNRKLTNKWDAPKAPKYLQVKQVEKELEISWAAVNGAIEYEVYISKDGNIDGDDVRINRNLTATKYTLTSTYANLDKINVILRYRKDGRWSDILVKEHSVLSKPENFVYYAEDNNYKFTFTNEDGKVYAVYKDGELFTYLPIVGEFTMPAVSSLDVTKIEVYEVAYDMEEKPDFDAGHGEAATPPILLNVPKIENLKGSYLDGMVKLTWNKLSNTSQVETYEIYMGPSASSLSKLETTTKDGSIEIDLDVTETTEIYFEVKAKMLATNNYAYSQPSDVVAVECIPSNLNVIQKGNQFEYTWKAIEGAEGYEIYLSADEAIDDSDEVYEVTGITYTDEIPAKYLAMENVYILFRSYDLSGENKEWGKTYKVMKEVLHKSLSFTYTNDGIQYHMSFPREADDAYVIDLNLEGYDDIYILGEDRVTIPGSVDISKAVLYEVFYKNGVANKENGYGEGITSPTANESSEIQNLYVNADKEILWDAYPEAISYNIYRSNDEDSVLTTAPIVSGVTDLSYDASGLDSTYYYTVRAVIADTPYISGAADPVVVEYSKADYIVNIPDLGDEELSLSGFVVGNNANETGVVPIGNLEVAAQYSQNFKSMSSYQISTIGVFDPVIEYVIDDVSLYTVSRPAPRVELITIDGGVVTAENITEFDYKISKVAGVDDKPGQTKIYIYNFLEDDTKEAPMNAIYRVQIASEILAKSQDATYSETEKQVVMDAILAKLSAAEGREVKEWELIYYSANAMVDEVIGFRVKFKWNDSHTTLDRPETREKAGAYKETTIKLKNAEKLPTHLNGN